jgi:hypothetical protein
MRRGNLPATKIKPFGNTLAALPLSARSGSRKAADPAGCVLHRKLLLR